MVRRTAFFLAAALLAATGAAGAAEYASVEDGPAILYDAPSLKAKKLFVASRHLPLEKVVNLESWVKVRDSTGDLAWIEKRALGGKRFVVVTADLAAIRLAPDANAEVAVQARRQVAMEWLENTAPGWIKVRLPDGATGYVKTSEVWGN